MYKNSLDIRGYSFKKITYTLAHTCTPDVPYLLQHRIKLHIGCVA